MHQCRIFNMTCSKDNANMDLSCAIVTVNTCWDVLNKGFCPRPSCTWPHPVPTLVTVSWTGGPELHLAAAGDKKILEGSTFPLSTSAMGERFPKPSNDLNFGAFDE